MSNAQLLNELRHSKLIVECDCHNEFELSKAILFDGRGKFPPGCLINHINLDIRPYTPAYDAPKSVRYPAWIGELKY